MCGEGARCSRVEVTGVKDPIPSPPFLPPPLLPFSLAPASRAASLQRQKLACGGAELPRLTFSCRWRLVIKLRGRQGGWGMGGEAGSILRVRGHGLIACFIYFLMLM